MKKVYCQPYTKKRHTTAWIYSKVPKGVFKYDQIRIHLPDNHCKVCGDNIWITPDEAADIIRALSAGLHHWICRNTKKILKAKKESNEPSSN